MLWERSLRLSNESARKRAQLMPTACSDWSCMELKRPASAYPSDILEAPSLRADCVRLLYCDLVLE